jgi:hypothetical protein
MEGLPPGLLLGLVAVLSACLGGLLTWTLIHLSGGKRDGTAQESFREEGPPEKNLLRVVQSEEGVVVLVRGERVRHLREITDRKTGHEATAAVRAVLSFAEGKSAAVNEDQDSSASARAEPAEDAIRSPSPNRQRRPVAAPRSSAASPTEPLKLIEEIDALLQERLQERPDLARRKIRLAQDIEGQLLIYVGMQQYQSTDEIPDQEVSAFIRETIKMWGSQ